MCSSCFRPLEGSSLLDEREFERWFEAAKRSLESAEGDLDRGDYNWACFKAQQAAELAVKGLLHGLGMLAYGHSVSKLLQQLEGKGLAVGGDLLQAAKSLDKYYVPTRYPNAWSEGSPHHYYTKVDASQAIDQAQEVLSWVDGTWRQLKRG
jgi:HEPN domain-containing protein